MPVDRLRAARNKTVGTKQTRKAVASGVAKVVFLAEDADERVLQDLLRTCHERSIEVVQVESMAELGRACGIEVGAASAAVIEDS